MGNIPAHDFNVQNSVAKHVLGFRVRDESDGKDYIYGQANGAISSGKHAMFNHSSNKATDLMTAQSAKGMIVKANVAMTTLYYAFFEIAEEGKILYENFLNAGIIGGTSNTGLPTGSAGDENFIVTGNGNYFEYHILGTQTILYPTWTLGTGLNISMDAVDNDGLELSNGITANSRAAYVVGTDSAFHLRIKFSIADASGTDELVVGFRKAQAYEADVDDYDDFAALAIKTEANPAVIKSSANLNDATPDDDDSGDTWADNATHTIEILVSSAGVVTYRLDDAALTNTVTTFTFDDAEVLIPFFFVLNANATQHGNIILKAWEVGLD